MNNNNNNNCNINKIHHGLYSVWKIIYHLEKVRYALITSCDNQNIYIIIGFSAV